VKGERKKRERRNEPFGRKKISVNFKVISTEATTGMDAIKAKLDVEFGALQKIQNDYSKYVASRQKLESQLKENELVLDVHDFI